ncbi:MAG TPA: RidA family protein [Aliidongia sp.]|nr:RidA family protein [Aliidongia sp.]
MNPTIVAVEPISSFIRAKRIPVSPAVRLGDLVFVSGLPPFSDIGAIEPMTIERQTEVVIEQMRLCLEAAGSSLSKIAKCTVYADDPAHFDAINRVYARYFGDAPPARVFICVAGWFGPFNVEIDCVAGV